MSNSTDPFPVINFSTPFAYLPQTIADQLQISRYIYVASLGAFIWDILTNLNNDYKLLFKYRIRIPTVIYFVSRISSLAFIITATIFQTGAVESCNKLLVQIGWCFSLSVSSSSLLFLLRAIAVFEGEKLFIGFFSLVWIITLGGSITVPFSLLGGHVGPTNYCINTAVKPFSTVGIIVSAANDVFIFFGISWRLITATSTETTFRGRLKTFYGGGVGLPAISKNLLQGGQQYYFITVGGNILTLAMILSPSIPAVYRAMFAIPNIAIENAMACRVFRNIRFGLIPPPPSSTFQRSAGDTLPISYQPSGSNRPNRAINVSNNPRGGIEITKSVESTTMCDSIPMEVVFPVKESDGDSTH